MINYTIYERDFQFDIMERRNVLIQCDFHIVTFEEKI